MQIPPSPRPSNERVSVVDGVEWFLTGSGGAVFSVTPDHATAEALATAMRQAGYTARACRTVG